MGSEVHGRRLDLSCGMQAARDSDLEPLDEVLQLCGLAFGVSDLFFEEFEVPHFAVHIALRPIPDPISGVSLGQGTDDNPLCFVYGLERRLLEER